jgi:phenylpropionate dioxygenase-like ring-hydroxylating dioxygenase large terminal subunit
MSAKLDVQHSAQPKSEALTALFQRMLDEIESRESAEWDAGESTLDPTVYGSQARYDLEIDKIFRKVPLCLGHEDQLREPGSMIARDLFGLPMLLVRDRMGEINVLLNVCRHRGARLIAGQEEVCRKGALSCPYHGWTYDLNGGLRAIPGAEGFPKVDKTERGLRRLPSVVRHGLIWAIMDPKQSTIDVPGFLGGIDDDLTALDLGLHHFFRQHARKRKTNWKLVMDAFQEVYHIKRLHAKTIAPYFLDIKSAGEGVGPHTRILVGRENLSEAKSLPPQAWDVRKHATLTHAIFPNTLIIYHPDYTSHLGMFPTAPDEILFVHTMFTPHEPRNDKERAHWERSFALLDGGVFGDEDLFISEQIQMGVNSGANDSLLLGRFEHHLRRFHGEIEKYLRG